MTAANWRDLMRAAAQEDVREAPAHVEAALRSAFRKRRRSRRLWPAAAAIAAALVVAALTQIPGPAPRPPALPLAQAQPPAFAWRQWGRRPRLQRVSRPVLARRSVPAAPPPDAPSVAVRLPDTAVAALGFTPMAGHEVDVLLDSSGQVQGVQLVLANYF